MPQNELTADLLGRRPDIAAQRARVESLSESVKAAKAAFYPNVSLSSFIGLSALETSNLFDRGAKIVGVTPAVSLPIFHSGALRANLAREKAGYDEAVAKLQPDRAGSVALGRRCLVQLAR
ncbi:hypothetical protein GKE73_09625 [Paludibacterium sp. dN 18-1]|uniref:Uncharacterized protein n=1 Tax=Paludibacterium denitrificans TaxID=2675226 RepID=A0A844GA29_9NEIS|nr:hypothetical protein [Paludibacterium denitrificans]